MGDFNIQELNNSKIRRTECGKVSALDVIRVLSGRRNPGRTLKDICKKYSDLSTKLYYYSFKKKGGGLSKKTPCLDRKGYYYLLSLLPGAVGDEYRGKSADLVTRYIDGDSDLALEILYRDGDKQRRERAEKRLQVTKTNKEVAVLVQETGGVSYAVVHNDRYKGLYKKNTAQLRADCGAKKKETPLNYMSEIDLTMNSLANQMAIKKGDPNSVFSAANNIRKAYREEMNKDLVPDWVETCLPPKKAREQLNGQLEIPLFS
ncbi:hypothetical protein Xen7305DRAFT_00008070 [Xenococcus sp. PCC 7305]|uniref:hypothetical protein n=1 Tax=Xenococcus sp. PCC 7305 TaxID=102125 RepID=UPI0002AC20F4|nr:hypothetical protein [Xenococcus sp. PCC 7305]ELS01105.1 hypothetical protein Xen7305DRAFT_00008070 [Xenococcus sp. PCC 7305]